MKSEYIFRHRITPGLWLILLCLASQSLFGQPASGTVRGGWRMPLMEENRMKTLISGDGADSLESGARKISNVKIQIFDDQTPPQAKMIIEAPECLFDAAKKVASSDGPIALKATDGSFSIKGLGFNWDQGSSKLSISNRVETTISRAALQSNSVASIPIHVTADQFTYDKASNLGIYQGNVQASEGERFKMGCDHLRVELPEGNDAPQRISATDNVRIQLRSDGRTTELRGNKADYESTSSSGSLRLEGEPSWNSESYFGGGTLITISNLTTAPLFNVSGASTMTIPVPGKAGDIQTAQRITLQADTYSVTETGAEFTGNVTAEADADWRLSSQQLSAAIEKDTQTVTRILAQTEVEIEQTIDGKKTLAKGDYAEFTPDGDALSDAIISGNGSISNDDFQSRADKIRLSKVGLTTNISADGRVSVVLPRQSSGNSGFLGIAATPGADTGTKSDQGQQELTITSDRYRLVDGIGTFEGKVNVTDSKGSMSCQTLNIEFKESLRNIRSMTASGNVSIVNEKGELTCHQLEGLFRGQNNRLEQLIATDAVELKQTNGVATGAKAVFNVLQQVVELTGDPELRTRIVNGSVAQNVLTTADILIWDQKTNTFKCRGAYRVRTLPSQRLAPEI